MKLEFCVIPMGPYKKSTAKPAYLQHPDEKSMANQKRKNDQEESEKKRKKEMEAEAEVDREKNTRPI